MKSEVGFDFFSRMELKNHRPVWTSVTSVADGRTNGRPAELQ